MLPMLGLRSDGSTHTGSTRIPSRTSDGSHSWMRNIDVMSAPSSRIHADTYGGSSPGLGTLVTQNVVTVPLPVSVSSSSVATPHIEQAPRGGMYTFWHRGQRWPTISPRSSERRNREDATPGV